MDTAPFQQAALALLGPKGFLTAPEDIASSLTDWRGLYHGKACGLALPASTAEAAALIKLTAAFGIAVVPQGGNTGLVGGQIPIAQGEEIVLSLQRLDKVRAVDTDGDTMIVEAGVTLKRAQDAAEAAGRLFPLSLASEGS